MVTASLFSLFCSDHASLQLKDNYCPSVWTGKDVAAQSECAGSKVQISHLVSKSSTIFFMFLLSWNSSCHMSLGKAQHFSSIFFLYIRSQNSYCLNFARKISYSFWRVSQRLFVAPRIHSLNLKSNVLNSKFFFIFFRVCCFSLFFENFSRFSAQARLTFLKISLYSYLKYRHSNQTTSFTLSVTDLALNT